MFFILIRKLILVFDLNNKNFIKYNNTILKLYNKKKKTKIPLKESFILVEFNNWCSNHVVLPSILTALKNKFNSKILSYPGYLLDSSDIFLNFISRVKWFLGNFFLMKKFGVYNSLDIDTVFWPDFKKKHLLNGSVKLDKILRKIRSRQDLLLLTLNGIKVGDLIYDGYLKKYKLPTIDLKSEKFKKYLEHFLILFEFWLDYFSKKNIKAIVGFHSVYSCAIPLRVAIKQSIPTFVVSIEKVHRLTKDYILTNLEHNIYKYQLPAINKKILKKGIIEAKNRLNKRFKGFLDSDILYLTKTPYGNSKIKRVLKINNKIKILIAPHSFCDAPHALGEHFFPDYYMWLEHLCDFTKKVDYDWYIKCHPNFTMYSDNTIDIIRNLISKYNITYLEPDTSHRQIISDGINFGVTVHGNIGNEYPLFNIPIINASINNFHKNYKFNINPKNFYEYEKILMNLKDIKIKINKKEIYEFYFMKYIYNNNLWFVDNFKKLFDYTAGYDNLNRELVYDYFINEFNEKKFKKKVDLLINFIESKDYLLNVNLHSRH
jgi:hypothetical protein